MKRFRFTLPLLAVVIAFWCCGSSAFAADSSSIVGRDVSSVDSIPAGFVAVWPMDAAIPVGWLPCNGQAVPADCLALRKLMSHVPNYNGGRQFLRGSTSGAGTVVADSTRSHAHAMDQHSHTVSGTAGAQGVYVGSQSIAGTAAGQLYDDRSLESAIGVSLEEMESSPAYTGGWFGVDGDRQFVGGYNTTKVAQASNVTGHTSGGTYYTGGGAVSGYTNLAGASATHATGDAETAPAHTLVKYIIKAH